MKRVDRYTRTAISLHWLMALLIIAAFGLGLIMTDMPGLSMAKLRYFSWHKWLGVTVFLLAVLRLGWRLTHPAPLHSASVAPWQQRAAGVVHVLLYGLIFLVPLSGYLYSLAAGVPVVYLGVLPLPVLFERNDAIKDVLKLIHQSLDYTMAGFVALHALAALKHRLIDRDGTLARMLPFSR